MKFIFKGWASRRKFVKAAPFIVAGILLFGGAAAYFGSQPDKVLAANAQLFMRMHGEYVGIPDDSNTNYTPGSALNFIAFVRNLGASTAGTPMNVTIKLPTGFTIQSVSPGTNWSCDPAPYATDPPTYGQVVTCTYTGTLAGFQDSSKVTILTQSASSRTGSADAFANVICSCDPSNGGNQNQTTPTLDPFYQADMSIAKKYDGPTPPIAAGSTYDYELDIKNAGPSDVATFTITDTLDPNLTFQSASAELTCNPPVGQTLTCTGGPLTSGQTIKPTITVEVDPAYGGGTITNQVHVDPTTPTGINDPYEDNNDATSTTDVVDEADLSITKTPGGTFNAGQQGTYTLSVTNAGLSDATNVTVTDHLPAGLTYASATGVGWSCSNSNNTVTCTRTTQPLPTGAAPDITVIVNIDPSLRGNVSNSALVHSTTNDPNPNNNEGDNTTPIVANADLEIKKTHSGDFIKGENEDFQFEVINHGPASTPSFTVTDTLDPNLTYVGVSGGPTCDISALPTITCTGGTISPVDSTTFTITVTVDPNTPTGPISNTGTVSTPVGTTDPNNGNNSDTDNPDVVPAEADLAVQLTHEAKTYHPGDKVTFTYHVQNLGPATARDVVMTDTLPSGLTFDSIVASVEANSSLIAKLSSIVMPSAYAAPNTPFDCTNNAQQVSCTTSALPVGSYLLTMVATIGSGFTGNLTSVLAITSSTPDPNPNNNQSSDTVSDVAPGGLANTGQNLWTWLAVAMILLMLPTVMMAYRHKKA